jgi:hypothetical protein
MGIALDISQLDLVHKLVVLTMDSYQNQLRILVARSSTSSLHSISTIQRKLKVAHLI